MFVSTSKSLFGISTSKSLFGKNILFKDYIDYMNKCSSIYIAFYTKNKIDLTLIKDYYNKNYSAITGSVIAAIYQVDDTIYNEANSYDYNINFSKIIDCQSFSL